VSLSDFRGKKVMLSFHRFASCPFCNLAINDLKGRYKKLAWASKLEVIIIFQSPEESIEKYVVRRRSLRDSEDEEGLRSPDCVEKEEDYPFMLLSDVAEKAFSLYGIRSSLLGLLASTFRFDKKARIANDPELSLIKAKPSNRSEASKLPAEFLIDEKGMIVDVFRAKTIDEHIPLDRVSQFLVGKAAAQ